MRGPGRGPAPQQNVESDPEVDERDQTQPVVKGTVGRDQNDAAIESHRLAYQRVRSLRPDTGAVELALQFGSVLDVLAVYRDQLVARLDPGLRPGPIRLDLIREQAAILFDPRYAVVGRSDLAFRLEIEASEDHRCHCQQEQQDSNETELAFPVHGFPQGPRTPMGPRGCWMQDPTLPGEQLHCHVTVPHRCG